MMSKMKKGTFVGAILLLVLIGSVAFVYFMKKSWFIAATVNGTLVSRVSVIQELEKQGGKSVLDDMIMKMLIRDEVHRLKIVIKRSDIDAEIKTTESQVTSQGGTLDEVLEQQGMTRDDLTEQVLMKKQLEQILADKIQVSDEEINKNHLEKLKSKVIWSAILSIPVIIIGMFFMNIQYAYYIMWAFATPVVFWFGKDFFINAFKQLKARRASMDTLVAVSTGTAYIFSVFNTIFGDYWHNQGLHAHVYFEAAAVVIAFILLGKMLEEKAKGKTSAALKKLIGLQPNTCLLYTSDAADERSSVDLGGRRIIKKKKYNKT